MHSHSLSMRHLFLMVTSWLIALNQTRIFPCFWNLQFWVIYWIINVIIVRVPSVFPPGIPAWNIFMFLYSFDLCVLFIFYPFCALGPFWIFYPALSTNWRKRLLMTEEWTTLHLSHWTPNCYKEFFWGLFSAHIFVQCSVLSADVKIGTVCVHHIKSKAEEKVMVGL